MWSPGLTILSVVGDGSTSKTIFARLGGLVYRPNDDEHLLQKVQ